MRHREPKGIVREAKVKCFRRKQSRRDRPRRRRHRVRRRLNHAALGRSLREEFHSASADDGCRKQQIRRERKVCFGFSATELTSGGIISASRLLGSIESTKPNTCFLTGISNLRRVTAPWTLTNTTIASLFAAITGGVVGVRFIARSHAHGWVMRKKGKGDEVRLCSRGRVCVCV